ncbi:CBS domain-containing protein, partial [bacterium]|nr:CBS domain-containing protein [bacterium]
MLTRNWMTRNVVTIDADESMSAAANIMKEYKIKSLPVMSKGRLVGIVSNGDLKRASASDATSLDVWEIAYLITQIKVRDIMTKDVVTAHPLLTVDE